MTIGRGNRLRCFQWDSWGVTNEEGGGKKAFLADQSL